MIESLLKIGELELQNGQQMNEVASQIKNFDGKYFIKVTFDCDESKVDFDRKEIGPNIYAEYYWVDNNPSNLPQYRVTTNQLKYVIGFDKKGEKVKPHKFILEALKKRLEEQKEKKEFNDLIEMISKVLSWYKKDPQQLEIKKEYWKDSLYTIVIKTNGNMVELAKHPAYLDLLKQDFTTGGQEIYEGKASCQFCGSQKVLKDPSYPAGKVLKIYNVDKKGFISRIGGTEDSYLSTHTICPSCRNKIYAGLNYIEKKLQITTGKLNAFIFPYAVNLDRKSLQKLELDGNGWFIQEDKIKELQETLKDLFEKFQFTVVYGKREQNKFRYYKSIVDVPVTRLVEIAKIANKIKNEFSASFRIKIDLNLGSLYRVLPLKLENPQRFLEAVESMVDSIPIKKDNLLREFLSMLKCIRYASCEARYDNAPHNLNDFTLVQTTLIQVGFIKLLYELGLMETVKVSPALSNSIDKDIVRFMEYTQLTDKQKALFLLGVLIAEIGRAQYKKGDHKKSILDKINFEGMPREKVMALANRIVQSLRNYNILVNNEGVYSEMMKLLTYVIKDLNDPVENTYYILAGYSYQTNKILIGGNQNERS